MNEHTKTQISSLNGKDYNKRKTKKQNNDDDDKKT